MSNVLDDEKRHQIVALGRLGWSLRRIEQATGVRRETISGYLKAAGIAVHGPGRRSEAKPKAAISPPEVSTDSGPANPAISSEVSTDSGPAKPTISLEVSTDSARPGRAPSSSACEPYRELIADALARGRNAMGIWQDLVDRHGFPARYASVRRFVAALQGQRPDDARVVITTEPGEEGQVDYGDGPMVRHSKTGKYRRTRLFILTLGYSRKSIRLLVWQSSAQTWAELHERAFRRLGGTVGSGLMPCCPGRAKSTGHPANCMPEDVNRNAWKDPPKKSIAQHVVSLVLKCDDIRPVRLGGDGFKG